MKSPIHQDPRISAFAERKMQTWTRLEETAAQADAHRHAALPATARGISHVTLSREAGADGAAIALLVGEQLGWEVYDGNLLDQVAQRHKESRLMLDLVDETQSNWVFDVLGPWMDRKIISHDKYAIQMSRMIQLLARAGNAVFVGRGAQFLLPRATTFSVRIVAPVAFRAARVQEGQNLGAKEALEWIHRTEHGRHESMERYFRHDITDPHLYDMVLNAQRLGLPGAADQIVHAVRHRA